MYVSVRHNNDVENFLLKQKKKPLEYDSYASTTKCTPCRTSLSESLRLDQTFSEWPTYRSNNMP